MKIIYLFVLLIICNTGCTQKQPIESSEKNSVEPSVIDSRPMIEEGPPIIDSNLFEKDMRKFPEVLALHNNYERMVSECRKHMYSGNYQYIMDAAGMYATMKTDYELLKKDIPQISEKEALQKLLYQQRGIKSIQFAINNTNLADFDILLEILNKHNLSNFVNLKDGKITFNSTQKFENFNDYQAFAYHVYGWSRLMIYPEMNSNLVKYLKDNGKL
jgi:hypothetical protein